MKRRILAILLALAMGAALFLAGCSSGSSSSSESSSTADGETVYTLRFSAHEPETSSIMIATRAWFDEIEEATDGHVVVEMYYSATLASASGVGDMVSTGGVDIGWLYTSYYPTQFTLSDVITLPMQGFAEDTVAATEVLWDLYESYDEVAEQWDSEYKVLQLYANPGMILGSNDPITSVSDIKGMSIRVPSGAITEVLEMWGAVGNTMATNDIYEAMEKNTVSGYIFDPIGCITFSLPEVTTYYLDMPIVCGAFGIVVNWDSWNALPTEYQEIIESLSGRDASIDSATAFSDASEEAMTTAVEDYGIEVLTPTEEEYEEWKEAADEYAVTWTESITESTGVDGEAFLSEAVELYNSYAE